MNNNFEGVQYRLANNWFPFINPDEKKPINYLEIGCLYGANVISVLETYAKHPLSLAHCIDPWIDYNDYREYTGEFDDIYNTFLSNIIKLENKDKIIIHRGYSHEKIPKLINNFFDIIYIDGNHNPEYVLEDAVLAFRKLKIDGIMIFDDYGWGGPDLTQKGIDAFLAAYSSKIERLGELNTQVFIRKIKPHY
jgi:hypothetical protein